MLNLQKSLVPLIAAALTFGIASAQAATLNLSYSTTAAGTTGSGAISNVNTSDLYTYGNSFGNLTTTVYTPTTGPSAGVNFEFYDDYSFTLAGGSLSSISATVHFGQIFAIDNLEVRLFNATGNEVLPVFDTPAGGVITASNTSIFGGMVTLAILDSIQLGAGTYVLEMRGAVSGVLGGSYGGVLNVEPVPLPASGWLMSSVLLGFIGLGRRRS